MPARYIYSFGEPINPEDLHRLLQQTDWAQTRDPLDIQYYARPQPSNSGCLGRRAADRLRARHHR